MLKWVFPQNHLHNLPLLLIKMLTLLILSMVASADVICPHHKTLMVETSLVLHSDVYRGLPLSSIPCSFSVESVSGSDLLVLVTTSSAFSLRQPMNSMNLIIRDDHHHLIVDSRPKIYRLFSSPIFVEIPTNLSFRAIIVVSVVINCSDSRSFRCSGGCDFPDSQNCSSVCVPGSLRCDSIDNCLTDEIACGNETEKLTQLNSSFRYHTILRSSQLMLVGFFVLNGAFIVFFLLLSICSVSGCFSRKLFRKKTRASRMTFVKYLREASAPAALSTKKCSPSSVDRHSNGLSFVTFATSPTLREVEPEVEDRSLVTPKDEICSLPSYQPEIYYIRRQTFPAIHNPTLSLFKWKRTSVAH
ncbi:hypothetical protein V3C99_015372 [Haemonchus contortus]